MRKKLLKGLTRLHAANKFTPYHNMAKYTMISKDDTLGDTSKS